MGSPMLITSEYVTSSTPPSPPPGGVDTLEGGEGIGLGVITEHRRCDT